MIAIAFTHLGSKAHLPFEPEHGDVVVVSERVVAGVEEEPGGPDQLARHPVLLADVVRAEMHAHFPEKIDI